MLTDTELKHLKPKAKPYKVTDRDGMYVLVSPGGTISFRVDYRLHGRRETVTLGKYAPSDLSLARAREKCIDAKRMIAEGQSPAIEKQREKRRIKEAKSFGQFGEKWLQCAPMADSTRAMRRSIFERELLPVWKSRLLTEITPGDLREHCLKIVDRGAPATAIHVRDILKQIYAFAKLHGEKAANPADEVGPASIATFVPKDRSLSPSEIRVLFKALEQVATIPTIRLGMRFILLSMVRKSEFQDAVWNEVDFENAVWSIPKERMKRSRPHNVYLSTQMLDILIALKTCAGNSKYLLPSRYDADAPMSRATLNRVTYAVVEQARKDGLPLEPFTVHDLRRTGSTLLNEMGFNSDWVEKCLAHEDGRSSRGVYNKAEYEQQRRHMMQEWSNSGRAMEAGLQREPADLLVLDLMMPGEDGLAILRRLREGGDGIPVIMLTARGDPVDRVIGLEMGADDYLGKPFLPRELVARINALLRRLSPARTQSRDETVIVGPFTINYSAMTVLRDGNPVALSSREFALMGALARSAGRPLTRAQLIDRALGRDAEISDRAIDVQVGRLRKAIGDDADAPRFVRTIWGVGYMLTCSPDG